MILMVIDARHAEPSVYCPPRALGPKVNAGRRFASRETDPLIRWRLSPIDKASLDKWEDYTEAKEAMFFHTDTADAQWTIFRSDDKKRARLACMRHFLASLDYPGRDARVVGAPDPLLVGPAGHMLDKTEHILGKSLHPDMRHTG